MSRVQELTWVHRKISEGVVDTFDEEITVLLSAHDAPALEALDLQFGDAIDLDPPRVPPTLFSETVPSSLRRLSIYGRRLSHGSILLEAPLISLTLNECNAWQTIDEALDVFSRLPNLEQFTALGDAHPVLPVHSEDFATPREPHSVELPRLKKFAVKAAIPQVVLMLRYLRLPLHCALYISTDAGLQTANHGGHLRDLVQELSLHYELALTAGEAFQTQVWRHRGDDLVTVSLHAFNLVSSPPPDSRDFLPMHENLYFPTLQIDIEWCVTASTLGFDASQFLICNMPILQAARTLVIPRYHGPSHEFLRHFQSGSTSDWRSIFANLQQVETLQVEDNSACHILRTFCERPSRHFPHALFPRLHTIKLSNVPFHGHFCEVTDTHHTWMPFQGLLNGLEPRLRPGVLKRVSIRKSDLDEAMVETLRGRWGKVLDWDGETEGSEMGLRKRLMTNVLVENPDLEEF